MGQMDYATPRAANRFSLTGCFACYHQPAHTINPNLKLANRAQPPCPPTATGTMDGQTNERSYRQPTVLYRNHFQERVNPSGLYASFSQFSEVL